MRPYVLAYLYRNRLRVHRSQSCSPGWAWPSRSRWCSPHWSRIAAWLALPNEVVHAAIGPANLQLRARDADGFDERLLGEWNISPASEQAAPLLEQTATDPHTLDARSDPQRHRYERQSCDPERACPFAAESRRSSPTGIGLSSSSAEALGLGARIAADQDENVTLKLRGTREHAEGFRRVGSGSVRCALARAVVAVMPLEACRAWRDCPAAISRILVQTTPGREVRVRGELKRCREVG